MTKKKALPNKKKVQLKKSIKDFLTDEDGYVSKETILKVGLGTVAGIGMLGAMSSMAATHTNHPNHTNNWTPPPSGGPGAECPAYYPEHSNQPGHTSHVSY